MMILLTIIITLIIVYFLYKPLKLNNIDDNSSNIAINKKKLVELANDLKIGLISEEDYNQATYEIEQNLASELNEEKININSKPPHFLVLFVALFIVFASYFIYNQVKSEKVELPKNNIISLTKYLENNPDDSKSWQVLGSIYSLDKKLIKAKNAYEKSYNLGNKNLDLLTEYASILATLNDNQFNSQAIDLVKEALEIDKNSVKALYLAGIIAANNSVFDLAKSLWQKALNLSEKDGDDYIMLSGVLRQLGDFINAKPPVEISIVVDIPEDIYKSRQNDFIMIYAKNSKGRPMPIAIEKIKLQDFNGVINLNDSNSVMPTNKLSDAKEIVVVARISKSGGAMKQAGDIDVASSPIKSKSQTIELKF